MSLPTDDQARKALPMWSYLTEFFPDAFIEVVKVAVAGGQQHSPGEPLHWARGKSMDQLNTAARHMFDHSTGTTRDVDGTWHLAKAIWRLSAELQTAIEASRAVVSITAEDIEKRRGDRNITNAFERAAWCKVRDQLQRTPQGKWSSVLEQLDRNNVPQEPWGHNDVLRSFGHAAPYNAYSHDKAPAPLIDYSFEDQYKPGNGRGAFTGPIMDESGLVIGAAGENI